MNNIGKIKDFIINENESKMIINQVSDNIGLFYNSLITNFCDTEKILLGLTFRFVQSNSEL